jgi:hypothetical protein
MMKPVLSWYFPRESSEAWVSPLGICCVSSGMAMLVWGLKPHRFREPFEGDFEVRDSCVGVDEDYEAVRFKQGSEDVQFHPCVV